MNGFFSLKNKDKGRKQYWQGVITVETSYMIPLILLLLMTVIQIAFYYHDKNILMGVAAETAVVGAQQERWKSDIEQSDVQDFYNQSIAGKLILFQEEPPSIEISDKKVKVSVRAKWKELKLKVEQTAVVIKPESKIRRKQVMKEMIEDSKDSSLQSDQ